VVSDERMGKVRLDFCNDSARSCTAENYS
jgi:hypothetical protein